MMSYSHSDFFHLDKDGISSLRSTKPTRCRELENVRSVTPDATGADFSIDTRRTKPVGTIEPPSSSEYSAVGGTLEATLKGNRTFRLTLSTHKDTQLLGSCWPDTREETML
ncbi:hypothetical protein OK016_00875 [Vibrio chagasii]|nr:hypothetical protein [Vibrio chagasii]